MSDTPPSVQQCARFGHIVRGAMSTGDVCARCGATIPAEQDAISDAVTPEMAGNASSLIGRGETFRYALRRILEWTTDTTLGEVFVVRACRMEAREALAVVDAAALATGDSCRLPDVAPDVEQSSPGEAG